MNDNVENINLEGLVLGRACSIIAQKLLSGVKVNAYNAEKAVITGNFKDIFEKYTEKQEFRAKGNPYKSPKYPRQPHMLFKRAVRNMLPHQKFRGREALSNLRVYIGAPQNVSLNTLEVAKLKSGYKYVTLEKLSSSLGVKW